MKIMKGKKTYSWLAFLAATQFPELSAPVWGVLADAGVAGWLVAWLKIGSALLGFAGAAYGRWRAGK